MRHKVRCSPFHNAPCVYCGEKMSAYGSSENPRYATKDHITPRKDGGSDVVRCCLACNRDKASLTLNEWRFLLTLRRRRPVIFYFERLAVSVALRVFLLKAQLLLCVTT